MARNRPRGGWTLIELAIGAALALIVGGTLMTILTSTASVTQTLDTASTSQAEARRAVMAMENELRRTGTNKISPALPAPPGTASTITFQIPGSAIITGSGQIDWDPNAVTYSLVGTQLLRTQPGSANRVLANSVVSVAFRLVDNPNDPNGDMIVVQLSVRSPAPFLPASPLLTLGSTIRPRHTNK